MPDLDARLRTEDVLGYVANRAAEGLQLEFKEMLPLRNGGGRIERSAIRSFVREVVSFANAGGGTLIYGVRTENLNGVDEAAEAALIPNAEILTNMLQASAAENISPTIAELDIYSCVDEQGNGFLIASVPRSEERPHMSTAQGEHCFYKRSDDKCLPMSRFEIEDQLMRRRVASLDVNFRVRLISTQGNLKRFAIGVSLENSTNVSAESPYLIVYEMSQLQIRNQATNEAQYGFVHRMVGARDKMLQATNGLMIHPGTETRVCEFDFGLQRSEQGEMRCRRSLNSNAENANIELQVGYGNKNATQKTRRLSLTEEQLEDLYDGGPAQLNQQL